MIDVLIILGGTLLAVTVLLDGFELIILPRRARRRFMPSRIFLRVTWKTWRICVAPMPPRTRETCLGYFGPGAFLLLLVLWAVGLITAFAMLHVGLGGGRHLSAGPHTMGSLLYFSGVTFFTLGYGDITPLDATSRFLAVLEAGLGFGFLAVVIGYLPVLYGGFSQREQAIVLLDARAGSPPCSFELLRRHGRLTDELQRLLQEWEVWSAQLLESHISYPILCFFRSQHTGQSWLGALTAILDSCALIISSLNGPVVWQAQLTFAMARHAVVDLAQVLGTPPQPDCGRRSGDEALEAMRRTLFSASADAESAQRLVELREMYEPFVGALSPMLSVDLPPWDVDGTVRDNWRTSAWGKISAGSADPAATAVDEHFQ